MLDFGDVSLDINAEAEFNIANATLNVGSLLSLTTTFNPATFAASTAVDVFIKLFNGAKERRILRQQVAILEDIRSQLNDLHRMADSILRKLDELPAIIQNIVRDERLNDHYVDLDATLLKFQSDSHFRISRDEFSKLQNHFFALCRDESRISNIAKFVGYVELLNFINSGKSHPFVVQCLKFAINRLELLQVEYGKKLATEYINAVKILADRYNSFAVRPVNRPFLWPDTGVHDLSVHNLPPPRASLKFGEHGGGIEDYSFEIQKVDDATVLLADIDQATVDWEVEPYREYKMSEWRERCARADPRNLPPGCERYNMMKDAYWRAYLSRQDTLIAAAAHFQNSVMPSIKEQITRFREIQELKHALLKASSNDYTRILRDSQNHLRP